ncbi:hypothetical protein U27_03296 [Candidatus Vecturithrix granuli]|uniref:DUF4845 domain-containing protein n=1 Tax=Vecturithrix granuli TaxID=1499967 RepID=A0A081BVH9_VECG1|nr:hypothetical protein U27_03296 [Candidatus Vecturithrix granuli]
MNTKSLNTRDERGAVGIKAIIALVIVGVFVYAGIQLIPLYWDHWNFEDEVTTNVQFAYVNYDREKVQEALTAAIYGMLDKIGAQYEKKNVRVKVDNNTKKITVEVWYSRTHNFPVFPPNPKPFYIKVENTPIS